MEEETDPSPEYIKAFNNGYLLTKHDPALISQITAMTNENNAYFNALIHGKAEYEKEVRAWARGHSRNEPRKR